MVGSSEEKTIKEFRNQLLNGQELSNREAIVLINIAERLVYELHCLKNPPKTLR